MAQFSHTYRAPFRFLEDGETEEHGNACSPLTICDADNNDLANIYSRDDSTVSTTREEAIAVARLFAAAPTLFNMVKWTVTHDGECLGDHPELLSAAKAVIEEIGV